MTEEGPKRLCPYCGGSKFDYGNLITSASFSAGAQSGLAVYHSSSKNKHSRVWIFTSVCMKCGHIDFYTDPKQLKESINKKKKYGIF